MFQDAINLALEGGKLTADARKNLLKPFVGDRVRFANNLTWSAIRQFGTVDGHGFLARLGENGSGLDLLGSPVVFNSDSPSVMTHGGPRLDARKERSDSAVRTLCREVRWL